MSEFGNTLRQLRQNANLTQSQLAESLGIAFSTVSMYERGEREPDFEMLETIADHFNVSMDFLYGKKTTLLANNLTPHENKVITAYRDKPEMQQAVDTLLGITKTDNESEERPVRTMRIAALGGGVTEHKYTATDEEIDEAIAYDEDEILD